MSFFSRNRGKPESNIDVSPQISDPELKSDINEKKFGTATVTTESVGQFNDEEPIYDSDGDIIENSIYPEVRAAVPIKDDPTIQINHWGTWFLTTVFVIIFAGVNQFF